MEEIKKPLTIRQVVEGIQKGDSDFAELAKEIKTSNESFASEDRRFNCIRCGAFFTPQMGQWIFYKLCDSCFNEFDTQKMRGRFRGFNFEVSPDSDPEAKRRIEDLRERFGGGNPGQPYYESCDEWIKATKVG